MHSLIQAVEAKYKKPAVVDVRSGDTVRVHQRIQEGGKTRTQVFEGLVIRTRRMGSLNASILTRRIASGVGVEKGFMIHSPLIEKIEVVKRSKVRRNYLSYMRSRQGKSARLAGVDFDRDAVNKANDIKADEPEIPVDESAAAIEAQAVLSESDPGEKDQEPSKVDDGKSADDTVDTVKVDGKPKKDLGFPPEPKAEKADTGSKQKPADGQESDTKVAQTEEDKAKAKKAKAEAFRQSQVK